MKSYVISSSRRNGMTLIELTVVILVLLSLISVLFIGAAAWKAGSDRAGCIMQIRNVQVGVRSYANLNKLDPGDPVSGWSAYVIGPNKFVGRTPVCPANGTYSYATDTIIPPVGTLAMTCSLAASPTLHSPEQFSDW